MLQGKIWNKQFEEDGDTYKLLMKLPNTIEDITSKEEHKILTQDFLILCYLWCSGNPADRA